MVLIVIFCGVVGNIGLRYDFCGLVVMFIYYCDFGVGVDLM